MTYPGNPAISPEVQQRIRSTFEQTLGLAERGSRQEAALGCDFILQLDPQFRPAQTLVDRLKATDGAVDVEDLRAELAGRPSRAEREAEAAELFDPDTDPSLAAGNGAGLDGELPDLEDLPDLEPPPAAGPAAPAAPADAAGLRREMEQRLARRRFGQVLELAEEHREVVAADPDLAKLAAEANDRREAAPYVTRFLDSARQARQAGNEAEAEALEEKARSLDPTHPDVPPPPGGPAAAGGPEKREGPPREDLDLEDLDDDLPDLPSFEPAAPGGGEAPDGGLDDLGVDLDAGGDEGDRRIRELLQEGQEASDRGDYQGAIDVWSRVFLIDIDHQEASDRIEEARRRKSEQERRVEETYQEALRAAQEGDTGAAREALEEVLRLAPTHIAAAEQLDRLDSGEALDTGSADAGAARPAAPPPPPPPEPEPELKEEILIPPEPGEERSPGEPEPAHKRTLVATRRTPRRFVFIGAAVLVLVVVGAVLLYQNRDRLFPNAEPAPTAASQLDPIDRATALHDDGKTEMAIGLLRRLPPTAPQYEEAQALISQWEAAGQPPAAVEFGVEEPAPQDDLEERQVALLARAAATADAGDHLLAAALVDEAAALGPLPEGGDDLRRRLELAVADLQEYIDLLDSGSFDAALPDLWLLHEEDPANPDVRRLIATAYYNLAVRALQRGETDTAVEHLEEAVTMLPEDEELRRQLRFASSYQDREKDLLYRIYVKYLPTR